MRQYPYAIVVLGKEPVKGAVMTRLAKSIGDIKAVEVQIILARHILKRLCSMSYPIILQLKGNPNSTFANQCRHLGIIIEEQVDGTLTDKIYHASQRAKRTLTLGMDMPLIDIIELEEAMRDSKLVLGPSEDGGYWLIGGTDIPLSILTEIPWSTNQVWQSTVDKCTALGLEYKVLSRQQDIDTLSDLQTLLANPKCPVYLRNDLLHILNSPSPSQ